MELIAEPLNEISFLKNRLHEIKIEQQSLGISKNRKRYCEGTIAKEVIEKKRLLTEEQLKIESKLRELRIERQSQEDNVTIAKNILKECFGSFIVSEIFREVQSRREGNAPNKLNLPLSLHAKPKQIKTFKEELIQYHELILNAREAINKYIRENEPTINKANFLKSVSSLNKCLPPTMEINKNRRIIGF